MKFIIATNNTGKLREISDILSPFGIDVISQAEAGIDLDVPETGETFFENALIKAKAICEASGMPAIADDSGLVVEALGGAPGVYSKRYGGGNLDDAGLCAFLLQNMKNMEQRRAKFVCSIVCVFPDGRVLSAEGECRGKIAAEPLGSGGFGYDPVFIPEGAEKTMAQLTPDEKNSLSHRGAAIREFAGRLGLLTQAPGLVQGSDCL